MQPQSMAREEKGVAAMSNLQDPKSEPEGELTDEQTSDVSGGIHIGL